MKIEQEESAKALEKHKSQLLKDEDALKAYELACKGGTVDTDAFKSIMKEASAEAKEYAVETKGATGSTDAYVAKQKKVQDELKKTTEVTKGASLATKALSVAGNMLFTFITTELIKGFVEFLNVSDNVAAKAQEIGSSFNSAKSDIEDYKERVAELKATISDSQSSFQDVTDARKELYDIQSEMIEKYGDEVGAIDAITKAVDIQSDSVNSAAGAWDKLADTQWRAAKNKFNENTLPNWFANFFGDYTDNMRMFIMVVHLISLS